MVSSQRRLRSKAVARLGKERVGPGLVQDTRPQPSVDDRKSMHITRGSRLSTARFHRVVTLPVRRVTLRNAPNNSSRGDAGDREGGSEFRGARVGLRSRALKRVRGSS